MFASAILLVGIINIATSYSYWTISGKQTTADVIGVGCFNITFSENSSSDYGSTSGNISLTNTYPMSDARGMALTPYAFTITNTCDMRDSYQINLETLSSPQTSTMDPRWVKAYFQKVKVNGSAVVSAAKIGPVNTNASVVLPDGASYSYHSFESTSNILTLGNDITDESSNVLVSSDARVLDTGTLDKNQSATYILRLWVTEEATMSDVGSILNNSYYARVVVAHTGVLSI